MKILFKSAVTLTFLTIIFVATSFLLTAMKKLYIDSWFVWNPSVAIGLLSGLILTTLISLANFHQLQRAHAKERAALLAGFQAESAAFQKMAHALRREPEGFEIPAQEHHELELALARLDGLTVKILRSERISPLKGATIQKFKQLASPIAKAELAFDRAFAPFAESCAAAYHAHSILPYLGEETERQATQRDFMRNLQQVYDALQPGSALDAALRQYLANTNRFLGFRQTKEADA